jgi:hypothetical protein
MSAILLQLTGHSRPGLLQMQHYFRIPARISNFHHFPITGPFRNHRPIFTSTLFSIRQHPSQNPRQARRFLGFLDKIPEDFIFYGIIGLNSAVFIMWYMAIQKYVSED